MVKLFFNRLFRPSYLVFFNVEIIDMVSKYEMQNWEEFLA